MANINKNENKVVVNVYWTGGWDSTFRMIQLSERDIIIQPFYLKDNRRSEMLELNAIFSLTEEIRNRASTKCTINELISMKVSDIDQDNDITQSYQAIARSFKKHTKRRLGGQYDWLARFSVNIDHLELSLEKDSNAHNIIKANGDIKKVVDDIKGEYYVLDKSVSNTDIIRIFGNYHFPLAHYSKLEMKKEAEEKGFMDLMNKTWFCQHPIDNQPCGACNPCIQTIESGLDYRLGKVALRRYRMKKFFNPIYNTIIYKGIKKMKRTLLRSVLLFSFIAFPFSTFSQKAGSFADSRDGRTYKTVKIGDQWWMAENLNYKTASGSWAYEDKESYAAVYGRLYDWETATKVCPSGWHLPGDKEWKALTDFLGGEDAAGGKLKEAGTAHWREPNTGANNESGFSALPGGSFLGMGMFFTLRDYGYWWSSTESSSDTAWYRNLTAEKSLVERNDSYKELGMSVRCIQDR